MISFNVMESGPGMLRIGPINSHSSPPSPDLRLSEAFALVESTSDYTHMVMHSSINLELSHADCLALKGTDSFRKASNVAPVLRTATMHACASSGFWLTTV